MQIYNKYYFLNEIIHLSDKVILKFNFGFLHFKRFI